MLIAIGILAFLAISLWAWVVLHHKPNVVRERMLAGLYHEAYRERRLEGNPLHRLLLPMLTRSGSLLARLLPHNLVRSIDHKLMMANEPMPLPVFLALWIGIITAGVVGFFLASSAVDSGPTQMVSLGIVFILLPVLIPYTILRRRVRNRQRAIVRALPDALDLLMTSVEAGLGIDSAFALVSDKTRGPLAEAFVRYLRETGLGRPRREALLFVAQRTGVPDFVRIANAVAQSEELGSSLGDVLRIQADELRTVRRQRAQEAAQKAPVKMTIPLALCFLPAMIAVIVVPSVINLVNFVGDIGAG